MNRWVKVGLAMAGVSAIVLILANWSPSLGGVEVLRQTLLSYGPWAALISSGLMILQATIAPFPTNVTIAANGLVFGPFWGGLLSWTTLVIGASLCFALSKRFGKPLAVRFAGRSIEHAEKFFERYGLFAMLTARLIPFIPFDAVSYVAGFAGVPFSRFLVSTAVGSIPSIIMYSYLGSIAVTDSWWIAVGVIVISLCGVGLTARVLRKMWQSAALPAE